MLYVCACVVALLGADASATESLSISRLANGQRFEIQTEDCAYVAELVDRTTGQCRMRVTDGKNLTPQRTVYIVGATRGVQDRLTFLRMHEVQVGLKLELGLDDLAEANRAHTTTVMSIKLLPVE